MSVATSPSFSFSAATSFVGVVECIRTLIVPAPSVLDLAVDWSFLFPLLWLDSVAYELPSVSQGAGPFSVFISIIISARLILNSFSFLFNLVLSSSPFVSHDPVTYQYSDLILSE